MDETFLNGWLSGVDSRSIDDEASIVLAREQVRDAARAAGLDDKAIEEAAIVVSELARNQLRYAYDGRIGVRGIARGIEIVAADRGHGIASPARAFAGTTGTGRPLGAGLGIGLAAVRRLSDELDVDVRIGEGSCLAARKLAAGAPRLPEVAIFGRALPGENIAGDDATFVRSDEALVVALADGLGHGPDARAAASRAMAAVRSSTASLAELGSACARAVEGTRGCVLALARLDHATRRFAHLAVGDISCWIVGREATRRFVSTAGILGTKAARKAPRIEEQPFGDADLLVMHSDGIKSRIDFAGEVLRQMPIVVAEHLVERHARDHDDAMVIVVR